MSRVVLLALGTSGILPLPALGLQRSLLALPPLAIPFLLFAYTLLDGLSRFRHEASVPAEELAKGMPL